MPERFGDILTLLMGALAVGYVVYEIERRRRKLHEIWDVLDEEDALLTESARRHGRERRASALHQERRWLEREAGAPVRQSPPPRAAKRSCSIRLAAGGFCVSQFVAGCIRVERPCIAARTPSARGSQ